MWCWYLKGVGLPRGLVFDGLGLDEAVGAGWGVDVQGLALGVEGGRALQVGGFSKGLPGAEVIALGGDGGGLVEVHLAHALAGAVVDVVGDAAALMVGFDKAVLGSQVRPPGIVGIAVMLPWAS